MHINKIHRMMQLDLIECEIQMINAHQIEANLSFDVSGIRIWDLI